MRAIRLDRALVAVATLLFQGCTTYLLEEHISYWKTETEKYLPVGSTLQEAQDFFAGRGIELRCCVSAPPEITNAYFALERKVGRVLWTQYDVAILVDVSETQKVERTRVQAWGMGL